MLQDIQSYKQLPLDVKVSAHRGVTLVELQLRFEQFLLNLSHGSAIALESQRPLCGSGYV
jgi:hypothetical protein